MSLPASCSLRTRRTVADLVLRFPSSGYTPYWLYFVAFVVIIVGLIGYFWFTPPEEEAAIDVTRPVYVNQVESESSEHIAGLAIGDLVKSQQQRETAV